jgi:hypothetical protein
MTLWIAVLAGVSILPIGYPDRLFVALGRQPIPAGPSLHWIGPANGDWSVDANWKEKDHPRAGRSYTLIFDDTANTSSTDDIDGLDVESLTVTSAYTSTITLANDLRVNRHVTIQNGTIRGNGKLNAPNVSVFSWEGGAIDNESVVLGSAAAHPKLYIDGGAVTLGGSFDSYANAVWTAAGDVTLSRTAVFTNEAGAVFDIQVDRDILSLGGSQIINSGTFKKTRGAGMTRIGPLFTSKAKGTLLSGCGVTEFRQPLSQQAGSATYLNGGGVTAEAGFILSGGQLKGVGTFTGSLDNRQGVVIPGLGNTTGGVGGGQLNINGDYTQGSGGALVVNVDAAGNVGVLNVQPVGPGANGVAALDGILTVNRDPNFTPAPGSRTSFLTCRTASGSFASVVMPNNTWNSGGRTGLSFSLAELAHGSGYGLNVN